MNAISSIAMSGMQAAQRGLNVAAHNVANAQTRDFRRQQMAYAEQAGGGVTTSVSFAEHVGNDLAGDAVAQMQSLYLFKANLRTVQVEREMLGSLLDVTA